MKYLGYSMTWDKDLEFYWLVASLQYFPSNHHSVSDRTNGIQMENTWNVHFGTKNAKAYSVVPDQAAPSRAVWSGSALWAEPSAVISGTWHWKTGLDYTRSVIISLVILLCATRRSTPKCIQSKYSPIWFYPIKLFICPIRCPAWLIFDS